MKNISLLDCFEHRHQSPSGEAAMLEAIESPTLEALITETVPQNISYHSAAELPQAISEYELTQRLRALAHKNKVHRQYIGLGYYETLMPAVIRRSVLENPAWYTAYTPYQAEISQGRLEVLLYFQTLISDLTQLPLANASLLDESTAAAEAMAMCYRIKEQAHQPSASNTLCVIGEVFPQTLAVLEGRASHLGIKIVRISHQEAASTLALENYFAILLQYPDAEGAVYDSQTIFKKAQQVGVYSIVCADILALTQIEAPGTYGVDVVVGSTQRLGVPLGFGGPHAAYFATKMAYKRQVPGRIIGISQDSQGQRAFRMALQTREQHIKRGRATSNICTAQVLPAILATFYAIYYGPKGLQHIGETLSKLTHVLYKGLHELHLTPTHKSFFDTLKVPLFPTLLQKVRKQCTQAKINLRYYEQEAAVGISLGSMTTMKDVDMLLSVFAKSVDKPVPQLSVPEHSPLPSSLKRRTKYLQDPVFSTYTTEHELVRFIRSLEEKDLSLIHGMIPLGSCTMKLNATAEMEPLGWDEFSAIHPFVPSSQVKGYEILIDELGRWLCKITGFAGISFQPNAGSQGEFAGLSMIRAYHCAHGEKQRNIILIPSSAHGTNPASAHMAGLDTHIIQCNETGNIDLDMLLRSIEVHKHHLAGLMITYPSTHGVFEEDILFVCEMIHKNGGLVYMDGANMNAQVGLTSPARIGSDVCHLNLHKTFCIPHGGGGPGMGPIAVAECLLPYLPQHPLSYSTKKSGIYPIASAPWSSGSLLLISYAYIALMGREGLRRASMRAILHANYIKVRLQNAYPVLYTGKYGRVAHELILDCRSFQRIDITVEDIAKRLIDYGFHAPTVSFPVPGTLMIEPTESEGFEEIERFCEAMLSIRKEIQEIETGKLHSTDNPLKCAPHSAQELTASQWRHSYSRERAAYPLDYVRKRKYWPPTSRIDNAVGDRNLQCSCPSTASYAEEAAPQETHNT